MRPEKEESRIPRAAVRSRPRKAVLELGLALASMALLAAVTAADDSGSPFPDDLRGFYSQKPASRDGIGKVYMGREISFVMGHRGVDWLERNERQIEERPDLLVASLDLEPDDVVADIGAGSGYFSFRLSSLVPEGRVLAVDIQPEMLEFLERRRRELGIENVDGVRGTITDPGLTDESVDAALMVDAYHEFSHPREMMEALMRALVPGGRVFLVEYRGEDPAIPIYPLHKMTVRQARKEFEAVGFEFVKNIRSLPLQHLMVFRKPA
jgi:SAM-dependent methyltransferase